MKHVLFYLSFLSIITQVNSQSEWAPVGAKWWYLGATMSGYYFVDYECTGQEFVEGKNCQVVGDWRTYQENGKVYIYQPSDSVFVLRYDFNAPVGSTYQVRSYYSNYMLTCIVDSITFQDINGQNFQIQHIKTLDPLSLGYDEYEKVVTGIGSNRSFLLKEPTPFTDSGGTLLLCFESDDFGLLHINSMPGPGLSISDDCMSFASPVIEKENRSELSIFPNPASEYIIIETSDLGSIPACEVKVLNSTGQVMKMTALNESGTASRINVKDWPSGIYTVQLIKKGFILSTNRFILSN